MESILSHANGATYQHPMGHFKRNAAMPIAVIGMSCKCPGDATNPERLWQMCVDGRSAWSEIPKKRFNARALYHPSGKKPGASNVTGGHFLQEDVSLFDASFFNFSTEVASSMDPQFRLQLESTFEALENAGIPLKEVAGSQTAVFAGSFFHDYYDAMMRDPETLPRYCLTGNGSAMLANRVSHFFDLRGPSVTVDTGCSTGVTALHLACQSLRTGESNMAVVGGANVILNPDNFVAMSCLGFLGPRGKSYSFDSCAEGYGRGEGVATVVIKSLPDALKDGDTVRAVIRASAINQDGKTPTITSPSQAAQEELIRMVYRDAGLKPKDTAYIEAHGTGTKAGDPIEGRAIGSVFGEGRDKQNPLYMASIKANIGHLEAASGVAAVIKVAMALEKGLIPPSANFQSPSPAIDMDLLKIQVPRRVESWPTDWARRASLSNFGYGGTNAHVIMEAFNPSAESSTPTNGHALSDALDQIHRDQRNERYVFILSCKDEKAVRSASTKLGIYLGCKEWQRAPTHMKNLAYTLGQRRSRFPWVAATSAQNLSELIETLDSKQLKPSYSNKRPRLGFVFNGQGAQWHAMGRELISAYPVFQAAVQESDQCIKEFGAQWSLTEELLRDAETTRVNEPMMSLTLCTAIQLCLVRLLKSWGIEPTAVTAHSSGEAAAAYVAGALEFREALATSYFRGTLTAAYQEKLRLRGRMLAVGLGPADVEPYLSEISSGRTTLACVNSPSSVTISGDTDAIEELEEALSAKGIFARKLKVGAAYHSHHMKHQEREYMAILGQHLKQLGTLNGVHYSSPVTGKWVHSAKQLGPQNWVSNMVQPVLFAQSLLTMCFGPEHLSEDSGEHIDMLIEIGPHSALAGPIRQTLSLPEVKKLGITYGYCLERGSDAIQTMQSLVSSLLTKGYPVDLGQVNFPHNDCKLQVLNDLPSYPWNHSVSYWTESRFNKEHRHRLHPTHDLLGSLVLGVNPLRPTWRHIIRPSELPWVRDHVIQSDIVFPAAGSIIMAIEAMRQLTLSSERVSGYVLKDIAVINALVIPDTSEGIEVQLSLQLDDPSVPNLQNQHAFEVDSVDNEGKWTRICRGSISVEMRQSSQGFSSCTKGILKHSENEGIGRFNTISKEIGPDQLFSIFKSVGIEYGALFKNIEHVRCGPQKALCTVTIPNVVATMPSQYQQDHIIHPATLDSILQASYAPILASSKPDRAMVPTSIKSLFVSTGMKSDVGHRYQALADLHSYNARGFEASVLTTDVSEPSDTPVITVEGLFCQSIGDALNGKRDTAHVNVCSTIHWDRALSLMAPEEIKRTITIQSDSSQCTLISDLKRAAFYFVNDALRSLTEEDVQNMDLHHKKMHGWMKVEVEKAARDEQAPRSCKWFNASEGVKELLFEKVSSSSVDGQMLCRVGTSLARILRKEVTPLELMLDGKLLHQYYEKTLRGPTMHEQIQRVAKLFAYENPSAKILEIGAGTGGYTLPVLKAFSEIGSGQRPTFAQYDFTDISAGFFEAAKVKFSYWGDRINYKKLDIETNPADQNFEAGSYDLIFACQALHATRSMENTMTNVRKLLKPNGKLILVETTHDALDVFAIFGVLPGWWLGEEEERKFSPSLGLDMWSRTLKSTGFSGLDVEVHDFQDEEKYSHSLIISTAVDDKAFVLEHDIGIIQADASPPDTWVKELQSSLKVFTESKVTSRSLENADGCEGFYVFLDGVNHSVLLEGNAARFRTIKDILTRARGVLWVSFGGTLDCSRPESGAVAGLLRTLRSENCTKRYVSLDLEPTQEPFSIAASYAITQIFERAFKSSQHEYMIDLEYTQRGSEVYIPRYLDSASDFGFVNATSTDIRPEPQAFHVKGREIQMDIKTPGLLDSLYFKEVPSAYDEIPQDLVEIEPKAFGLNFRDVMVAMGQLDSTIMGFECSGLITRVGPTSAHNLKVGDRVCSLLRGDWATHNHVHWTSVSQIPDEMSFEEAASIPVIYATAYYSLHELAHLQAGETVLIHSAAGGVGQAAVALAQLAGAEVFATVGSEEKRIFLVERYGLGTHQVFYSRDTSFAKQIMAATQKKGVDVILNSLSGRLLQETWNCIATFGRFVEIGKRDLEQNASLKMAPFTRAASFFAVDLIQLGREKGLLINRMLGNVMALLREKKIRPVSPIKQYPISEINRAFRVMQAGKNVGKVVIKVNPDDVVNVLPHRSPLRFHSASSYLIVGGLGGIGRSLAQWFVAHGAESLILLSRNAESHRMRFPELIADLERAGCRISLWNCDVSQESDLFRVLEQCRRDLPPIRGIIQGAMVLQDSVFENMSYENWQAAIRPKVQGTINLHSLLLRHHLDFFIMLSSLTGISGHDSQANYTAGSTFQDAFARYRTSQGLPATSIDVGWVQSIGYVAENQGAADRLARMAYTQLEQDTLLLVLESAIRGPKQSTPEASQIVTGIGHLAAAKQFGKAWRQEPRFAALDNNVAGRGGSAKDPAGNGGSKMESKTLKESLTNAFTWEEAVATVMAALIGKLSDMFSLPEAEIDASLPISEYGVDSLVAVELRNWLFAKAGAEMSMFDMLQSKSLSVLAEKIVRKSSFLKGAGLVASNGKEERGGGNRRSVEFED